MDVTVRANVRDHISRRLRIKGTDAAIDDSESLFVSGRLDSLDVLETIAFLENEYAVNFAQLEFDVTLVDSIDAITTTVERWRGKADNLDR